MAFEGLKEKLKDQWADLSSKIQENSTFNNLREKFEEQSPATQRGLVAGTIVVLALVLLSFPYGYISSSQANMEVFEQNRELIQGLLHASRAAKEPSPLPPPIGPDVLKSKVEAVIRDNRLVPEQMGEIAALPDRPAKDLSPPAVAQSGVAVQAKKLNLEQIVALSHGLQNMGPGIKLVGFDIVQSQGQTHYYDLVARVVAFGLQPMTFEDSKPEPKGKKSLAPPRGAGKKDEDSE